MEVDAEGALVAADAIGSGDERPFAGVPTAIKNNRPVAGMRLTYGCKLMQGHVADYDHNVTARLKRAGFVIVGTTTLPEYGILPVSEAHIFGPTRNPWDLDRTPGGSSGGVGGGRRRGILPVAHGNDGGGSIRIPAACCGLVGLKPSRGRISLAPELGDAELVIDGMLTRHVEDAAATLDVLAGYEPGDATWAPDPPEPFAQSALREPLKLRIAATTRPPVADAAVDPISARAVGEAASAAALARPRGRGGRSALAGRVPAGAVRSRVLQPDRSVDRLVGNDRRPRPDGRGHGADELGDLLDGAQNEPDRRGRGGRAPTAVLPPAGQLPAPL